MLNTITVYCKFDSDGLSRRDIVVRNVTSWKFDDDYFYIYTDKSQLFIDKYLIARVSIEEEEDE